MDGKRDLYLSRAVMGTAAIKKYLLTILGALLTAFFGIGLVLTLTDPSMRENLAVCAVFLVLSALILWRGVQAGRHMQLARRYQAIFAEDRDGMLSVEELVSQTGKSGQQIAKELEMLFRRGFFKDCSLQRSPLGVRLSGGGKKQAVFLTVTCPHCGAGNRIRAGEQGFCEYCEEESTAKRRDSGGVT